MSGETALDKDQLMKLILSNIEYSSSTPERAREYLVGEGLEVDSILASGMSRINEFRNRLEQAKKTVVKPSVIIGYQRSWNHHSVKRLISETGNPDPMDAIKTRARDMVLQAFEMGWSGPPYSAIQLAKFLNIDVIPNDELIDARIVPNAGELQIQYNPFQRPTRVNFSVAHEIAHTLFTDCGNEIRNREARPVENRELEQLCNAAAAEIQLPYAVFSNDANSEAPSMNRLIELATKYNASLESVFLRYTEVVDWPCAILIGIFQTENKITIDYYKSSRSFPLELTAGIEIPENSTAYNCTSPGWTDSDEHANWDFFNGQTFNVYCAGISAYRRDNKPRVGLLIVPVRDVKAPKDSDKVVIVYGDATKPRGKGKKIIAQLVNTSAGLGRGFGHSLTKNYPIVKTELEKWKSERSRFKLGESNLVKVNHELFVFQMLAQKGLFQTGSEIPLRYNELRKCLVSLRETALELNCSVHMPAIGAGQAKGNWEIIIGMIHDELINFNIKVTIYLIPNSPITPKTPPNLTYFNLNSTWENGKLF